MPDAARRAFAASSRRSCGAAALALAALAYAAAIALLAWPLSADPARLLVDPVRSGHPLGHWRQMDRDLAVWVLGWTAHAIASQPLEIFQGNIFHPAPDALASSESLLGLLPISAPVFLLSGNPVLTHNVTVFAVVWIAALSTFALIRAWTGSAAAGFLAGSAFAFAPAIVAQWSNVISMTAVHLFPLVLLLAWRAARRPSVATLALLGATVALQVLSGFYVAYQLLVLLACFAPALCWEARCRGQSTLRPLAAIALGFLALLPVSRPYLRARSLGTLPDAEAARAKAVELAQTWSASAKCVQESLGWPVLVLALIGVVGLRRREPHIRLALLAAALAGFVLSRGPDLPLLPGTSLPGPYEILAQTIPGFASMRAPGRFVVLPLLALALLAGLGAGDLLRRFRRARPARGPIGTCALAIAGLALIALRIPSPPLAVARAPAEDGDWDVYRWLRDQPAPGAVVEIPAVASPLELSRLSATGRYMIGATLHGRGLVNGYSGHAPASAPLLLGLAQRLPDRGALDRLCDATDLAWIVVHHELLSMWERAPWNRNEIDGLEPIADFPGRTRVYRVERPCGALRDRLIAQLKGEGRDRSLLDHPLAALAPEDRRGRVEASVRILPANLHTWIWVDVTNEGGRVWPGLTIDTPGAVQLQARFRDAKSGALRAPHVATPLGTDLAPGETVRLAVGAQVPPPGDWVLEIGVLQRGAGWFADQEGGGAILRVPIQPVPFAPRSPDALVEQEPAQP